jgi:O-antigen/teichoic acid export membrane protein
VLSLISIFSAIISIPIAISVVYKFFPAYASGIQALIILLLALTLPVPFTSLSSIIVASKKDLRPFILMAIINGITVVSTSYFLIPKIGILGAAISQLIVNVMYSVEVTTYAVKSNVFNLSNREIGVILAIVFVGIFMFFVDSWVIDLILALGSVVVFRGLKIFTKDEIITIISFIPKNMKFLSKILFIFSS